MFFCAFFVAAWSRYLYLSGYRILRWDNSKSFVSLCVHFSKRAKKNLWSRATSPSRCFVLFVKRDLLYNNGNFQACGWLAEQPELVGLHFCTLLSKISTSIELKEFMDFEHLMDLLILDLLVSIDLLGLIAIMDLMYCFDLIDKKKILWLYFLT